MKSNQEAAKKQRRIFSENLKLQLEKTGKTQIDIVRDLGVTSSTVSDWVNAKKYPRVDKMQTIADYLGVGISGLREQKPAPQIEDELSTLEGKLVELVKGLSHDQQQLLLAQLEFLTKDRQ